MRRLFHFRRRRRAVLSALVGSALLHVLPARAQTIDPKVALPILLKVITYDEGFDARGAGPFVILVASDVGQLADREKLLAVLRKLSVTSIKSRPLRFVGAEVKDAPSLSSTVSREGASAILAVPGLSPGALSALVQSAEAKQLYSLALDSEMVARSVVIGVTPNAGRPQIVINERAARACGVRFETAVLRLAKVIQ